MLVFLELQYITNVINEMNRLLYLFIDLLIYTSIFYAHGLSCNRRILVHHLKLYPLVAIELTRDKEAAVD